MQTVAPAPANDFLARLAAGEPTFQLGIRNARTTDTVRIAHSSGHHAILVDLEHSTMSIDVAAALCAAASDLGLTPFVRTPEREYGMIGRLLDGGAQGIVAARIETVDQARTIARACRFPPRGQRSQLAAVPLSGMQPVSAAVLNPRLDAATIVQVVLETPEGIAAADAIAGVDGVDMIAVGTNDLTSELGIPGQHDHPLVRTAIATAAQACRRHGKLLMVAGISDRALHVSLSELGVCPLYLTGMDTDLLYRAARAGVESYAPIQEARSR